MKKEKKHLRNSIRLFIIILIINLILIAGLFYFPIGSLFWMKVNIILTITSLGFMLGMLYVIISFVNYTYYSLLKEIKKST